MNKTSNGRSTAFAAAVGVVLASGMFVAGPAVAAASLALNLTGSAIGSVASQSVGTVNGVDFAYSALQPTGTGVFDPFIRIQRTGTEQGYNTGAVDGSLDKNGNGPDANAKGVLDNKDTTSGWTRDLKFSELNLTGDFYEFVLDINESDSQGTGSLLSLDGLKLFALSGGGQNNESVDAFGNASGIISGSYTGTQLWDMDSNGDVYIMLDSKRAGSGNGSGDADMVMRVHKDYFKDVNIASTPNLVLWSRFGLNAGSDPGADSDSGFEEWAANTVSSGDGPCCGGDPGGNPVSSPGTAALALLGLGLVGWSRRGRPQTPQTDA